ncbi:BBS1 and/or ACBP domain containing protein [Asbolus verrucosus]|uniref:BBS1 and/or ACBP domain containing protein n=1 Tax=Asbolus verrucosus TaxID=1661398 RepID=A0A482W1I2_ASBVE|nr:BBS1 and/or ACBP domain containing protein [Asbolus verrucosus]
MSKGELSISRWLEAHSDRSAGLTTFARNAILADISGDGDHRLVLTDIKLQSDKRSRLKVYKGTLLTSDQVLPDIPSSVISFYTDDLEPKVPAIAVACGSDLLIFKNNKPFYKFSVPSSPIIPLEEESWKKLGEPNCDSDIIIQDLKTLNFSSLSGRSQELLTLQRHQVEEFVKRYVGLTPMKTSPIICMSTLNRSSQDKHAVACPILGTEAGIIYVLDPQTYTILHQANVCNVKATPSIIKTTGMYDVEYRIVVACRENSVCILRRGWLEGKSIIQLTEDIVDMILIPGDNFIVIATSTKLLHCYTKRGQRVWSAPMINSVTCLCLVPLKHLSTYLIAVGLKGGSVHLYHGRQAVDYTNSPDTPSALVFGQLGQEEHVMIIITMAGTINFKILKRTADFNLTNQDKLASPNLQSKPLPLPKRSKLFLEQSMRERQNPIDMHQNFQQDLLKLRLTAARALVQNLTDQSGTGNAQEQIKLSAQVLGLGPKFTLILTLENMNSDKPIYNFSVIFHAKPIIYKLSTYVSMVPLIPPGLSYKLETKVTEILNHQGEGQRTDIGNTNQVIRVFVVRKRQAHPVLAASINMPPTEMTTLMLCFHSIMSLDEKFKSACEQIKKFTKRPPDSDMLEVYSLYKQATVGDINISKPSDAKGKEKWEAWNGKKGLNGNSAKEQYVAKVKALSASYA